MIRYFHPEYVFEETVGEPSGLGPQSPSRFCLTLGLTLLHRIRPKRLCFLVLNTLARLICRARQRLPRFAEGFARGALDRFLVRIHARPPPLPG